MYFICLGKTVVDNIQSFKTEAVLYTLKKYNYPKLYFENTLIIFVADHKHLGVTLSNNGQWHKHIANIIINAAKVIGIMRKLKYTFKRQASQT